MRLLFSMLMVAIVMLVSPSPGLAGEYTVGPGDVLEISVWGHQEYAPILYTVRPDGRISYPLVGEIDVSGCSPNQVAVTLQEALKQYLLAPKVTVNVAKFKTVRVYVLGEAAKPGLYELEKQHNLLDAIGMAGGFTKDSAKKKVYVVKKNQQDRPLEVNLFRLLKHADLTQNVDLGEGDVVFIPSNGRVDFIRDVLPLITLGVVAKD